MSFATAHSSVPSTFDKKMTASLKAPGKPFIYLMGDAQTEKNHRRKYTQTEDALEEYDLIVDALYQAAEEKKLSEKSKADLSRCLQSRHGGVWEEAGSRIVQLSHYIPAATDILTDLMSHRKANVRLRVIQSLWSEVPEQQVVTRLIECGIQDKSKKVRQFAVQRIGDLGLKEFLPQIKKMLETEKDEAVIEAAIYALKENGIEPVGI